jgi:GNAT superfamily N-acetyltransferase
MPTLVTPCPRRPVVVRRATPADREAIHALFAALHEFNASLEERFALADGWEHLLDERLDRERVSARSVTLLAWDGRRPVGLAMAAEHVDSPLFRERRWTELTALYVAPAGRGGGAAGRLLEAVRAWARQRGSGELRLYVTTANERARRFYDAAGFRPLQAIYSLDLVPAASPVAVEAA